MDRHNNYDAFAEAHSTDNEHYERPASLALIGEVRGRRVLDAGCGSGAHAVALLERRAMHQTGTGR